VNRIAARWGLTSAAHFSRAFRAAYGVSPLEYRHSAARARA
jgi:AraC-like DNA-binding protein